MVSMAPAAPSSHLLIVSQRGYGKSTQVSRYPGQSRGGQGVRTFRVTEKTGPVAAARVVTDTPGQEILIISAKAQVVRITLQDVRVTGRDAQGVIVWRDREADDYVVSIACFQEGLHTRAESSSNGRHSSNGSSNGAQIPLSEGK